MRHARLIGKIVLVCAWPAAATAQFVDPAKWQQIKVGMPEAQALAIMGEPIRRDKRFSNRAELIYGVIVPKSQVMPADVAFKIWIDTDAGTVNSVEAPVCGGKPKAGMPEKPDIYLPQANSRFTHYPRLFDIRWCPSAGDYPMQYEVSFEFPQHDRVGDKYVLTGKWRLREEIKTQIPYANYFHPGGDARIRVRGVNATGAGPWSDYTAFTFAR